MRILLAILLATQVAAGCRLLADPGSRELPTWGELPEAGREVSAALWMADGGDWGLNRDNGPEERDADWEPPRMDPGVAELIAALAEAMEPPIAVQLYDLEKYASRLPGEQLLYDPQHLLSEPSTVDFLSFLTYHARESTIPIRVVLFAAGDEPAGVVDLQSLCDSWSGPEGSKGCMLAYFMGRPGRSGLYFPTWAPELRAIAGSARVVARCVGAARVVENDISQLDRFGVELSMHVFRAGKILRARAGEQLFEALDRTGPGDVGSEAGWGSGLFVGILLALLVLGGIGILAVARKGGGVAEATSERGVFLFDDHEVPERLGGPHGGGAGAAFYFARDHTK